MKKLIKLWIVLTFTIILAGNFNDYVYGADSDFYYTVFEDGVFVCGYYGLESDVIIPEEIEGHKVTGVFFFNDDYEGEEDYKLNLHIKTITIPSGVIHFNVSELLELTDIYISADNEFFESENGLSYRKKTEYSDGEYDSVLFSVPSGRTGIVDIREGTTAIDLGAFNNCSKITGVNIPASFLYDENTMYTMGIYGESLETINVSQDSEIYSSVDGVLYDKEKKMLIRYPGGRSGKVIVPDSTEKIDYGAFAYCEKITEVEFSEGLTYIGNSAFRECISLKKVIMPDSVTDVEGYGFAYCELLDEIRLSGFIERIPEGFFQGCDSLVTLRVPASVKEIDCTAFYSSGIKEVLIDEGNTALSSGEGIICDKSGTKLIMYLPDSKEMVTVPAYITTIGSNAFSQLRNTKKIVLPEGLKTLEEYVFENCDYLEEVELPEGIEIIPKAAFCYCYSLKNIKIPSTVTSIGDYAFEGCYELKDLTIPENVESLGRMFVSGSNINNIYIESTKLKNISDYAFENWDASVNIYVNDKNTYDMINGNYAYGSGMNVILLKNPEPLELNTYNVTLYTGSAKRSATIKATLTDITGTVKWKTSKKFVATVKNGKITAVNKGSAVVTASVGGYSKKVKVTVKNPSISVVDGSETINSIKVKRGKTIYYRVNTNPSKSGIKLKIDSKAKKYAKVALKGDTLLVKGIKKGEVKFKLQSGKGTKSVKVKIS